MGMNNADAALLSAWKFDAIETPKGWFVMRSGVMITGYYASQESALKNALPYARAMAAQAGR